jgi:translation initiation factor IF-2
MEAPIAEKKPSIVEKGDVSSHEDKTIKPKQKPSKKKKGKRDTPARIIQLPTRPVKIEPELKTDEPIPPSLDDQKLPELPEPPEPAPVAETESIKERKKKKRIKQIEIDEPDKKLVKKKVAFKRKEVVEGSALYEPDKRVRKGKKGAKVKVPKGQKTQITTPKAIKRRVKVDDAIVLSDLAKRMGIKASEMISKLMGMGVMATVNQTIDFDTAALVATEFGYEVERASFEEETILKVRRMIPGK